MAHLNVRLTGTRPLLMHADTLADPLNPKTKERAKVTVKTKKTTEDHEWLGRTAWMHALYIDEQGPYIPGDNIESCIIEGGKLSKQGKPLARGMQVLTDKSYVEYSGPKDIEGLWNDGGFCDVRGIKNKNSSGNRTMRYRPIFRQWALECEILFFDEYLDRDIILRTIDDAGKLCGLGDYRPKFGRFNVEVLS